MGFLDNLLKKGAREIVSGLAQAATDAISEEFKSQNTQSHSSQTATQNRPQSKPAASAPKADDVVPAGYEALVNADAETKIEAVLAREFSRYEIRKDVSPTTIGGTGRFLNYSIGVYENGTPKLFIMYVSGNDCASRFYRWSKEAAEKAGIPMINFVTVFSNKIPYIIDRLHQYL